MKQSHVVQDAKLKGLEDLFINLTTGTWPSPFWVRTSDGLTIITGAVVACAVVGFTLPMRVAPDVRQHLAGHARPWLVGARRRDPTESTCNHTRKQHAVLLTTIAHDSMLICCGFGFISLYFSSQWLNFRDAVVYNMVVRRAPTYPLTVSVCRIFLRCA